MSIAEELEKLQMLRDRGTISEQEFVRAKQQALDEATARTGSNSALLYQLARSRTDRMLGGVCGGLGKQTDLPAWAWRIIFILTFVYFGAGLVVYLLLWIFLPEERAE
ncbi:MAG TPA: PspC domain-containing protein [Steroidobacteraceae bacterium]|jgi:phage shock protein C|nr:PspC domain-containing protein [Steroidobacteraceae bacterium]